MKPLPLRISVGHRLLILAIALTAFGVPCAHAVTVWTGPTNAYSQPAPDPTQATNQDRLTTQVWLTRALSKGLFNAVTETNATENSPAGTEWAFGSITNYSALPYTNWLAWLNGQSPSTLVGQSAVLHLMAEDTYLAIQFTFWGAHATGGFAYIRSTPAPPLLSSESVAAGQFSFRYSTSPGLIYVIQGSTNLADWIPLSTNVASSISSYFADNLNSNGASFYRVVWTPVP